MSRHKRLRLVSIEEAAKEAGCEVIEYSKDAQNIFNATSAECRGDARVYWFPTEEANKNHGEMCKRMGGRKVASGKNWTKYSPSC
jgi:hypothetical protein